MGGILSCFKLLGGVTNNMPNSIIVFFLRNKSLEKLSKRKFKVINSKNPKLVVPII